jgi:hypothetical protein
VQLPSFIGMPPASNRKPSTQNYLEFGLRLQEYIELCRKRDSSAALAYVRKNLAPWKETHFNEIQQAIALLAFNEHCNLPAYDVCHDHISDLVFESANH